MFQGHGFKSQDHRHIGVLKWSITPETINLLHKHVYLNVVCIYSDFLHTFRGNAIKG